MNILGSNKPLLHTDEILIDCSMSARQDHNATMDLDQIQKLRSCQVHTSVMLSEVDYKTLKKLGVDLTCDPISEA